MLIFKLCNLNPCNESRLEVLKVLDHSFSCRVIGCLLSAVWNHGTTDETETCFVLKLCTKDVLKPAPPLKPGLKFTKACFDVFDKMFKTSQWRARKHLIPESIKLQLESFPQNLTICINLYQFAIAFSGSQPMRLCWWLPRLCLLGLCLLGLCLLRRWLVWFWWFLLLSWLDSAWQESLLLGFGLHFYLEGRLRRWLHQFVFHLKPNRFEGGSKNESRKNISEEWFRMILRSLFLQILLSKNWEYIKVQSSPNMYEVLWCIMKYCQNKINYVLSTEWRTSKQPVPFAVRLQVEPLKLGLENFKLE